MTRTFHILLCLLTLLKSSEGTSVCTFDCCAEMSSVQSSMCSGEECAAAHLLTTSGARPCDQQCCNLLEEVSLWNGADAEEALVSCASLFVAPRLIPSPAERNRRMTARPQHHVKTHVLTCVFLC